MYNYIFKKLIHSAIVLFSVISAIYLFQSHSIIDPVDDFMNSSFGDRPVNKIEYEKAYVKEAVRQNKHLPDFYFDIIPSYFPDTLHRIILAEKRAFTKDLLRFSKCSDCTFSYLRKIENISPIHSLDSLSNLKVNQLLDQISRENNINDLTFLFRELESHLDSHNTNELDPLIQSYKKLSTSSNTSLLPKIVWHGSQNQLHNFIKGILTGNLGLSKSDGRTASSKITKALRWTLSINLIGFILAGALGLLLGLWSIKNDGRKRERYTMSILFFIYTMPVFWTATLLIIFFTTKRYGSWMDIFPSAGIKYWYADKSIGEQILLNASQLVLPIICITMPSLAYMSRIMKSKFSEVLSADFITALKAKGINQRKLYNKHMLKNGMIPYITILTGSIPGLFAGSLVIEIIFNVPGIGKLLYDSIYISDWAVISGIVILLSVVTILAYLLADILYSMVNPKISLE